MITNALDRLFGREPAPLTRPANKVIAAEFARDMLRETRYWPLDRHFLCVGSTGAGKSSVPRAICCDLAGSNLVQMVGIDLKAIEFVHIEPRLAGLAIERPDAKTVLEQLGRILDHRRTIGVANRWTSWHPTPEHPILAVLMDEAAEVIWAKGLGKATERLAEECAGLVDRIGRLGRALGVVLLCLTQRAEAEIIGGTLRNHFSQRFVLASQDASSYAMGLGFSAHNRGLDHFILDMSVDRPGLGLLLEPGRDVRLARAVWWTDGQVAYRMNRTRHLTVPLDQLEAIAAQAAAPRRTP